MSTHDRNRLSRILLVGLTLVTLCFIYPHSLLADSDDPPARVARLGELRGTVSIEPAGVNDWSAASRNYPVATGDRVYTDRDGRTELQIGQTVARMWHDTDLTVTNLADNIIQLGLAQGTLRLRTYALDPQEQVEIDTPNGALTISQPGDIRVDAYGGDGGTVVTVNSGEVELTGPSLSERVRSGQSLRLLGTNPIELADLEMPALDEFDSWSIDRDRHILRSNSARYVSRETSGYDDLDEYGDWAPQSDYGPVWYPRSVPADWVPYRYGHWVWTGPWGWTWVEDEPWGYAPFHYGRWARIDDRWGWIPGPVAVRPIWSPALVAFVGGPRFGVGISVGGGAGVSAWFPLGPGEPYTPWYHCSPRYVNQVNITNIRVTRIVNVQNNYNVVNVNNINYVHRTGAVTAVSGQNFGSARPVAANMIHLDPRQVQQAQVIPHPDIRPTVHSIVAQPVSNLRVPTARPTLLTQGGHQAAAVPGARMQPVPYKPLPANAMQNAQTMHPLRGGNPSDVAHPGAIPAPAQQRGSFNNGTSQPPANQGGMPQNTLHQPGQPPQAPMNNHAPQQFGGQAPAQNQPPHQLPPSQQLGGQAPAQNQAPRQLPPSQQLGAQPPAQNQAPRQLPPSQQFGGQPPVQNQAPRQLPPSQSAPVQGNAGQQQRPLVYRNEAPAPRPTFQQQQPAMNQHPGRPLEPQQIDNIRQGNPAGPQRDQELIPHAAPQQRIQQQQQAPRQQEQPRYSPPPQQAQPHNQQQQAPPRNQQPERAPANDRRDHNDQKTEQR
jgi:hypothetical protein